MEYNLRHLEALAGRGKLSAKHAAAMDKYHRARDFLHSEATTEAEIVEKYSRFRAIISGQ